MDGLKVSASTMSKATVETMSAGVALLIPASIGLLISGVPTILCPFPGLTVIPALLLSNPARVEGRDRCAYVALFCVAPRFIPW